jgi:hypothetical protein
LRLRFLRLQPEAAIVYQLIGKVVTHALILPKGEIYQNYPHIFGCSGSRIFAATG